MATLRTRSATVRVPQLVLIGAVAIFAASTIPGVRKVDGFDTLLDGWLQGSAYVLAAIVCVLRPILEPRDRKRWSFFAAALIARAGAFVVFIAYVRTLDLAPVPSVADVGWLAMYPLLLFGLVDSVRRDTAGLVLPSLLDGIAGACATAAVFFTTMYGTLVAASAPGTSTSALVTNLAYPILDAVLLLSMVAVFVASDYQPSRQLWTFLAAVGGFAVVDSIFVYQSTAGTFRPGTVLPALSLIVTAVMALSAWIPSKPKSIESATKSLPGLLLPGLFSLVCLVVVVYATGRAVPVAAVVFATAGLLVAIGRAATSFRDAKAVVTARRDARTDELSGLPNRRAFNEHLERALRGREVGRSLALLILDLDEFKLINDTVGHRGGDQVLALVGPRLRLTLADGDFLARIGGDEFALVLEDRSAADVEEITQLLRSNLREPFVLGDTRFVVDITVGIAMFPEDGREGSDLTARADVAMYDAKVSGIGHGFYRSERHQSTDGRFEGYERLRQAIEDGELVLHFQPQICLDSGTVVSVEALVRWEHPELGLLPPARFLPAVEGGGLMRLMTERILQQAIAQGAAWRAAGHEISVAVNVSVTDLLDPELPQQVTRMLDAAALPPSSLVLELTEDLSLTNRSQGKQVIAGLVERGVVVLIDDYGTGYSSLDYLCDLRGIGGIKLDRSFVSNADSDTRAQAIIRSTAGLAESLGVDLIIEGVETKAQRDLLPTLGCRFAQGYLFARPAPAEAVDLGVIDVARARPIRVTQSSPS